MAGLQDLLLVREIERQRSPWTHLASNVAMSIQQEREMQKEKKRMETMASMAFQNKQDVNTNASRASNLIEVAGKKIPRTIQKQSVSIGSDMKPRVTVSEETNPEIRILSEEAKQKRIEINQIIDNTYKHGYALSQDKINELKEEGYNLEVEALSGRAEPRIDPSTGKREYDFLSSEEWQRKVTEGKFSPTEIEHLQDLSTEHRTWQNIVRRLDELGISKDMAKNIEFENVNTPIGVISMPARFNLYGQFAQDPRYTAIKRDIEQAFQQFRKTTTGAQASDKELRMLRPLIASLKDRPEVFFDTIANRMENIEYQYNDRLSLYEAAGRDITRFKGLLEGRTESKEATLSEVPQVGDTFNGERVINIRKIK